MVILNDAQHINIYTLKGFNLQCNMVQTIKLRLVNEKLHVGLVTWREVYIFYPRVIQLNPEVDRGRLVYRQKGSERRVSYLQI